MKSFLELIKTNKIAKIEKNERVQIYFKFFVKNQGWELAHLLIAHRSFALAHRSFAYSLILLKTNERLWAIRSDRSRQMSDCERIAQRKWANEPFAQKMLAKKI